MLIHVCTSGSFRICTSEAVKQNPYSYYFHIFDTSDFLSPSHEGMSGIGREVFVVLPLLVGEFHAWRELCGCGRPARHRCTRAQCQLQRGQQPRMRASTEGSFSLFFSPPPLPYPPSTGAGFSDFCHLKDKSILHHPPRPRLPLNICHTCDVVQTDSLPRLCSVWGPKRGAQKKRKKETLFPPRLSSLHSCLASRCVFVSRVPSHRQRRECTVHGGSRAERGQV